MSVPRRRITLAATVLSLALLATYVVLVVRLPDTDADGSDYSAFHVAALVWRDGQGDRLYDQGWETARHEQLVPPGYHVDLPFLSPPATALLVAPLTLLRLSAAYRVAALLELALVGLAVTLAVRAAPPPGGSGGRLAIGAASAAGVGTLVLVLMGQWDGLVALGIAACYACLRRGRQLSAGVAVGLALAPSKPHLAIGVVAVLLGLRAGRALTGLALAGLVALLADLAVAGTGGISGWLGALRLSSGHSPLPSLLGTTGFAGSWLGDTTAAHVLGLALAVPAVLGCILLGDRLRRGTGSLEATLGGAVALGLLASPHLLMHDLAVLAPVAAWTLAGAYARSQRQGDRALLTWVGLNGLLLVDVGAASTGPPGRLTPVALAGLGVLALRATRQSGRGRGVGGVVLQS